MSYQTVRYFRRVDIIHISPLPTGLYAGPGDIVSNAIAWWGLRAYNASSIGANAVRLRESGGNTEQNFATIDGGGLDIDAITSFKGANNLFLVTLYDQTGNGNHLTQVTAGIQVPFVLSGIGSLPVLRFDANDQNANITSLTLAQPFTHSFVAKRTGNFTSTSSVFGENDPSDAFPRAGFLNSADTIFMYGGGLITVSAADNNFYAVQAIYNGATSDLNVDGTSNIGNPGTGGHSGISARLNQDVVLRCDFVETGLWPIAFSGAQSVAMSNNQHDYWGF